MTEKKPTNINGILVGVVAVVLLFVVIYSSSSPARYVPPTNSNVKTSPTPDIAKLEAIACLSADATALDVIKQVGIYTSHPAKHKSVGMKLRAFAKALDSDWKNLDGGEVYSSILALANDTSFLADSIYLNDPNTGYLYLDQFSKDFETFRAVCK